MSKRKIYGSKSNDGGVVKPSDTKPHSKPTKPKPPEMRLLNERVSSRSARVINACKLTGVMKSPKDKNK